VNAMLLINGEIYLEDQTIKNGYLLIENEKIAAYGPMEDVLAYEGEVLDVAGAHVLPGFIDQHIHGAAGADAMDGTIEANATIATYLPKEGTTSYLATTMTQSPEAINTAIDAAITFMVEENKPGQAEVIGLHLEGPFISPHHIGAQNPDFIVKPEIKTFDAYYARAKGNIKLVTYAPEEAEEGFTEHLASRGVVASAGHTDATFKDIERAIPAGLTGITHFHNAMSPHHHRTPGVVSAGFFFDQLKTELICDGVHLDFDVVRTTYKIKGREGIILITDAMRAKGLDDGTYDLGGQEVHKVGNEARLASGVLAGSVAEMNDVVRNVKEQVTDNFTDLMYVSAMNSAQQLGVFDRKGSIQIGKDADLVVLNDDIDVLITICRGVIGYRAKNA